MSAKNSWCDQMVEKKNTFDRHLLWQGTQTDEGRKRDVIM